MQVELKKSLIDMDLTQNILNRYNRGEFNNCKGVKLKGFPVVDNKTIIDSTQFEELEFSNVEISNFISNFSLSEKIKCRIHESGNKLSKSLLKSIGIELYPYFSYGVLNGGSATSYVDSKKNISFNSELYNQLKETFSELAVRYKQKPKGLTPAFINKNGSPGPSFLELKFRSLLLNVKEYKENVDPNRDFTIPIFQMTSTGNNKMLEEYYDSIKNSSYLLKLKNELKITDLDILTGIQPLIAAYTVTQDGKNKEIFYDENNQPLGLPGGHGHCFYTLKSVFNELYSKGIKFISIGNVDNIGYTLDPITLAILAISNKQAIFDFSYKTQFDIKGGVLIECESGSINCGDLGVAVCKDDVKKAESNKKPILFNCATGLFNLEQLLEKLDYIINNLPTRFTNQNKDIGQYSQAEQVTWEVMSLLDNFLVLAVDKYDRFLASKLLLENLATSGLYENIQDTELKNCAKELNKGLFKLLKNKFKLTIINNEWRSND